METLLELEKYLEDNCYSFTEITIGKHYAPEGYLIEEENGKYNFCDTQRGVKSLIKSFSTEKELVEYTLSELEKNRWYKAHLVAWLFDEEEIKKAEQYLSDNHIVFERNDIPNYSQGNPVYRIYVFGKDVLLLEDFKYKYYKIYY